MTPTDVTAAAERVAVGDRHEVTLSTGVRVRIKSVSAALIDEVQRTVQDPKVPTQEIDGKVVENPLHPAYRAAMEDAQRQRGLATTEAVILFGIELVDGMPPDEEWLPKLRLLERRGNLSLKRFNLEDPLDKELAYKSLVAVAAPDLMLVSMASGLTEGEVAKAEASFRREKVRRPDSTGGGTPSA